MSKEHCCQIDCDKDAEWEIYADGVPDTALSIPKVDDYTYISVMIDIKELAEKKRRRELNQRLKRLWDGSSQ